mmetsp:Transcript_9563/g.27733  ORF Transcript_9563/g.27733 Transcript_9563/m.27733 type:complete len:178 (+) Transcript_9563:1608-2141(+)
MAFFIAFSSARMELRLGGEAGRSDVTIDDGALDVVTLGALAHAQEGEGDGLALLGLLGVVLGVVRFTNCRMGKLGAGWGDDGSWAGVAGLRLPLVEMSDEAGGLAGPIWGCLVARNWADASSSAINLTSEGADDEAHCVADRPQLPVAAAAPEVPPPGGISSAVSAECVPCLVVPIG